MQLTINGSIATNPYQFAAKAKRHDAEQPIADFVRIGRPTKSKKSSIVSKQVLIQIGRFVPGPSTSLSFFRNDTSLRRLAREATKKQTIQLKTPGQRVEQQERSMPRHNASATLGFAHSEEV
ncbi:MAG TPA: hypothetical protein VKV15_21770 [Bryobacteraceae bacterium]|nr:hypothetical protein [Bryobacteraceae bacterium]